MQESTESILMQQNIYKHLVKIHDILKKTARETTWNNMVVEPSN